MPDPEKPLFLRSIYGLTIASDIDLPELCEADGTVGPDIVIRKGEVPRVWEVDEADEPFNLRSFVDGDRRHFWAKIPDTIRMSIRDGCEITYAIEPGCKEDAARLFLLGSGLGAVLMQRSFIVVHGNAITLPNRRSAIVCIGDSGAGKSTTAIAMMQRGYSILADDICPIGPSAQIEPGMPRAKLWDQTAQHLNIDVSGLKQVRDGDAKYNLPLGNQHCDEPRQIGAFVWLVPGDVDAIECSEVTGVERFSVLRNNIYRPEYLTPLKLEATYLKQVAQIAAQTKVFKVVRPKDGFDIGPLLDTISVLYDQCESELAPAPSSHLDAS